MSEQVEQKVCGGCGLPIVRETWTSKWAHKDGPLIMAFYPKHTPEPVWWFQ